MKFTFDSESITTKSVACTLFYIAVAVLIFELGVMCGEHKAMHKFHRSIHGGYGHDAYNMPVGGPEMGWGERDVMYTRGQMMGGYGTVSAMPVRATAAAGSFTVSAAPATQGMRMIKD